MNRIKLSLVLIFVVLPLMDLASLVWLAIRVHWTVAPVAVLLAGVTGAYLVRWGAPRSFRAASQRIAEDGAPLNEMLDGVLIFVAGVLLISPGLLSDVMALAILVPLVRRFVRTWVSGSIRAKIIKIVSTISGSFEDENREGSVVDVESRLPRSSQSRLRCDAASEGPK